MNDAGGSFLMFFEYFRQLGGPIFAALIGHFMRFAEGAVHGSRACLRRFIFESPSVIGFAIIASGISEHFKLGYATTCALAAMASWLGNAVVMTLLKPRVERWVNEHGNRGVTNGKSDPS